MEKVIGRVAGCDLVLRKAGRHEIHYIHMAETLIHHIWHAYMPHVPLQPASSEGNHDETIGQQTQNV